MIPDQCKFRGSYPAAVCTLCDSKAYCHKLWIQETVRLYDLVKEKFVLKDEKGVKIK